MSRNKIYRRGCDKYSHTLDGSELPVIMHRLILLSGSKLSAFLAKKYNSEEAKRIDQVASKAESLETGDGVHHMKPAMIREIEKEIDEMLMKLAAPLCKFCFSP